MIRSLIVSYFRAHLLFFFSTNSVSYLRDHRREIKVLGYGTWLVSSLIVFVWLLSEVPEGQITVLNSLYYSFLSLIAPVPLFTVTLLVALIIYMGVSQRKNIETFEDWVPLFVILMPVLYFVLLFVYLWLRWSGESVLAYFWFLLVMLYFFLVQFWTLSKLHEWSFKKVFLYFGWGLLVLVSLFILAATSELLSIL